MKPVISTQKGAFHNIQKFKIGQKVRFYCEVEAEDDVKNNRPLTGEHVVMAIEKSEGEGYIVKTDKSKDSWIHVHWFAPIKNNARLGGIARAKKLSAKRRKEIATKASHSRKKKNPLTIKKIWKQTH